MKIAVGIVRTLIGLLFLLASVTFFLNLVPQPELTGKMKLFTDGIGAAGYLMPLVKTIEMLCGIAFVSGRFVPLAVVLIASIAIKTFCSFTPSSRRKVWRLRYRFFWDFCFWFTLTGKITSRCLPLNNRRKFGEK